MDFPGWPHPMLDDYQYSKQKDFLDDEKQAINSAE